MSIIGRAIVKAKNERWTMQIRNLRAIAAKERKVSYSMSTWEVASSRPSKWHKDSPYNSWLTRWPLNTVFCGLIVDFDSSKRGKLLEMMKYHLRLHSRGDK